MPARKTKYFPNIGTINIEKDTHLGDDNDKIGIVNERIMKKVKEKLKLVLGLK